MLSKVILYVKSFFARLDALPEKEKKKLQMRFLLFLFLLSAINPLVYRVIPPLTRDDPTWYLGILFLFWGSMTLTLIFFLLPHLIFLYLYTLLT